jgi:hypothetical protein
MSSTFSPRRAAYRRLLILVSAPAVVLGTCTLAAGAAVGAFDRKPGNIVPCTPHTSISVESFGIAVLNGSGIPGRAGLAAAQLRAAGFKVTSVANAPESRWTDVSAVLVAGPSAANAAELLATRIPGAKRVNDLRIGHDVEIVVGTEFAGLAAPPPTGALGCGPKEPLANAEPA